jgi:hypothetical protein
LPHLGTSLKMSSLFEYNSGSCVMCRFPVDSSKGADKYRTVTRCFSLLLPPNPSLMCRASGAIVFMDARSTVFKFPASFSDVLHSRYIIALHLYQVTLNFDGGKLVSPIKPNHATNFCMGSSFQCRTCTSTCLMNNI